MLTWFKNNFLYTNKYKTHPEAVIIACYFNSEKSIYRKKAFDIWFASIKHLNYYIIECVIGDGKPELDTSLFKSGHLKTIHANDLLWHKESLLNNLVREIPIHYKYIFWLDTDIIFTNKNWLIEGVEQFKNGANIIQPFSKCVHLEKDELEPSFNTSLIANENSATGPDKRIWNSFCSNINYKSHFNSTNYDVHGHVGFAWGAKRMVLTLVPLFDRALIGGADHIIAHAAAGQFNHECIKKSFTENLKEIDDWSKKFFQVVKGKIGYVPGTVYHIWHGDIAKREYLKRVQEFSPKINNIRKRDENGLWIGTDSDKEYMKDYFKRREVTNEVPSKPIKKIESKSKNIPEDNSTRYSHTDDLFTQVLLLEALERTESNNVTEGGSILETPALFEGGSGGGAGAEGTWDEPNSNIESDNFS